MRSSVGRENDNGKVDDEILGRELANQTPTLEARPSPPHKKMLFLCLSVHIQKSRNCLQWGRSNLFDRAEWLKKWFTKPGF